MGIIKKVLVIEEVCQKVRAINGGQFQIIEGHDKL
jgi:hypothetical protein